jgi:hypothetical protein
VNPQALQWAEQVEMSVRLLLAGIQETASK